MRIRKREYGKSVLRGIAKGIITAACMAVMVWCMPVVSQAEATGKVVPNSVNIRKTPDVNSEVVGSSTIGKEVTIKGKVTASGTTWYQVYIDANTLGYIRSDMLEPEAEAEIPVVTVATESSSSDAPEAEKPESDSASQGTDSSPQETTSGDSGAAQNDSAPGGAQVAADESVDLQYAKLKVNSRVRPDPSTKGTPVGSLTEGTQVVVSGKSVGSDGKDWYYVTYTSSNGSEKTGFIRSDLLEMGEMLQVEEEPPQEEVPVEEPEPEPVVNNDYVLRLEQTENGPVWYLDDNTRPEPETLELLPLLESAYSQSQDEEEAAAAVVKQRIVIVVLVILLVALIVTVVILAFKLRDAYYEDYEDEDEEDDDEEEEEERPARRRVRSEEPEEERPARRRETQESGERRRSAERNGRSDREERSARGDRNERSGRSDRNERGERNERRASRERPYEGDSAQSRPAKTGAKRKSKNFLLDDDEFEFEFLNMDDKDLK